MTAQRDTRGVLTEPLIPSRAVYKARAKLRIADQHGQSPIDALIECLRRAISWHSMWEKEVTGVTCFAFAHVCTRPAR
jgi:hypothetical protein